MNRIRALSSPSKPENAMIWFLHGLSSLHKNIKQGYFVTWDSFIHSLVFSLEGRAWQEPEPSHVTSMALAHGIKTENLNEKKNLNECTSINCGNRPT